MGTDRTKSLSEKDKEQLIRLHFGRETGRPTVEEVEARQWLTDFEEFQTFKELGLLDSLRDQLSGEQQPRTGADPRLGGAFGDLLRILTGETLDKEALVSLLGGSVASAAAPLAPPIALFVGWWLAEKYVTFDREVKDEAGNVVGTKTYQMPPILHTSVSILQVFLSMLIVLQKVIQEVLGETTSFVTNPLGWIREKLKIAPEDVHADAEAALTNPVKLAELYGKYGPLLAPILLAKEAVKWVRG